MERPPRSLTFAAPRGGRSLLRAAGRRLPPPYALTRAPQGAALADRQSRLRCALDRPAYFHPAWVSPRTVEKFDMKRPLRRLT